MNALNNMCEKNLLKIIYDTDFALIDLSLYLDTHPTDSEALRVYNDYIEIRRAAINEYLEKVGPLTIYGVKDENYTSWITGPWPWERGAK